MSIYFRIKNLEKSFDGFKLGPISFELKKGSYFVLLGPTGCGKTTFLRTIAGIINNDKGNIFVNNRDLSITPVHKRKIGYVSQKPDLFPHLSVEQNIAFGLKYLDITKKEKKERIFRFLDLFGLEKFADRPAYVLSGGESKVTALARSLIIYPDVLLLDEPLGMLDHNGRKEMIEILKRIHKELSTTTIHVTHDRHEAWSFSQNCGVMNNGNLEQKGLVSEIFRKPENEFVADFLGGINIFKAESKNNKVLLPWLSKEGSILIRPERISIVSKKDSFKVKGKVFALHDFVPGFFGSGFRWPIFNL